MASALSYRDKQIIREATNFIKLEEGSVKRSINEFADKGSFGLWLDAKGFFKYTDKKAVLGIMKYYRVINDDILACLESVEEDDGNAYQRLMNLYRKIEEFDRDADIHANGKSKALCSLAKRFLDNRWKLDHKLKRVECVVLDRDGKKTACSSFLLRLLANSSIRNFDTLQEDNLNLQKSVDVLQENNLNLKESVDELHEENQDLKNTMKVILRENKDLRDMISGANERADQRLAEMVEETRRNMEKLAFEMRMKT